MSSSNFVRFIVLAAFSAGLLAAHCQNTPTTEDDSGTDAGPSCTYTVSGATQGSGSCTATGEYAASGPITVFAITVDASAPSFQMSVELGKTPEAFEAGTYTAANVLGTSGEYLSEKGPTSPSWSLTTADGDFTLALTSIGPEVAIDGGVTWPSPHGTLTVTLQPGPDTTGVVNGKATF
jgi:hypothetical protein